MTLPHAPRRLHPLIILAIVLAVVGALPPAVTLAGVKVPVPLDNTTDQFAGGSLQRTALAQLTPAAANDLTGGVQIAKIGVLSNWFTVNPDLPQTLSLMGVAVLGNRIYSIGGVSGEPSAGTKIDKVWSIPVDTTKGELSGDWVEEPSLPAGRATNQGAYIDQLYSVVESPAVASVAQPGGGGYIYVVGGRTNKGAESFSSFDVRIATVGSDGRISGWRVQDNARIVPTKSQARDAIDIGRHAAAAFARTAGGKTYVYVLGGLQAFRSGGATTYQGSTSTFYAQVGADGRLFKPGNPSQEGWDPLTDIPVVPPSDTSLPYGLWASGITVDYYPTVGKDAVYMIGGQKVEQTSTDTAQYENFVYSATINPTDGALEWSDKTYTLPEARYGHGGVAHNGNLYTTGGIPGGENEPDTTNQGGFPYGTVLNTYVNDDLSLPEPVGGGTPFVKAGTMIFARAFHGTALVRGTGPLSDAAFVFVFGGRGPSSDTRDPLAGNGSRKVIGGRIGTDEDKRLGYALDGWYYSKVHTLYSSKATLKEISWLASIDRGKSPNADIAIQFRTSLANSCSQPDWPDNNTGWQDLDGSGDSFRSSNGLNVIGDLTIESRCLQYRARLASGSTAIPSSYTPGLLFFGVQIIIPGDIDLWVTDNSAARFSANGTLIGIDVYLTNQNRITQGEPTLSAATGSLDPSQEFFVDMFVYGPGGAAPPDPVIPQPDPAPAENRAYAMIPKSAMGADQTIQLVRWCAQDGQPVCNQVSLTSLFPQPGAYTLIVVTDSLNYICEGGQADALGQCPVAQQPGKNNNIKRITLTVQAGEGGKPKVGTEVRLPAVRR
jgi:hypothetical protein